MWQEPTFRPGLWEMDWDSNCQMGNRIICIMAETQSDQSDFSIGGVYFHIHLLGGVYFLPGA